MPILSDYAVQMDIADANSTALDATKLASGTHGFIAPTWTIAGAGTITVEASANARLDTIRVKGTGATYLPSDTHRVTRFDHTVGSTYAILAGPALTRGMRASARVWVTPGMPNNGAGAGSLYDLVSFIGGVGSVFAVAQIKNGDATGRFVIGLHSDPGGVSQRVSDTVITPGVRIGIELGIDVDNGTCFLGIFDINGVLIAPYITAATNTGGQWVNSCDIGNREIGTNAGTHSDFEGLDVEFTKGEAVGMLNRNPIWVPKYAAAVDNASTASIPVTITNCKPGDMAYAFLKHESGLIGVTVTTPTDLLVEGPLGLVSNVSGDPRGVSFFGKSLTGTGSIVFTATLAAARDFKNFLVVVIEPPSTAWNFARSNPSVSNSAASGTAFTLPAQLRTSPNNAPIALDFVGFAEFGNGVTMCSIGGLSDLDMFLQPTSADHSSVWMRRRFAAQVGASGATATLSGSNGWTGVLDSFIATLTPPIVLQPVATSQRMC